MFEGEKITTTIMRIQNENGQKHENKHSQTHCWKQDGNVYMQFTIVIKNL